MQLKKRQAQAVLDKLQMQVRSTHHKMGTFVYAGKPILRTRVSFGRGDIPGHIAAKFRGQLKLNERQFQDLIKCPLDYEGYVRILKEKGYIPE